MARFTPRLTKVKFEDATDPIPLSITVGPGEGDFSHSEMNAENAEIVAVYDRDQFDGLVEGQDLVQEGSITVQMRNETLTSAAAERINDFVLKRGTFKDAVSVDSNPRVFAHKIILTFDDGTTETVRELPHCVSTISFSEGRPANTFTINYRNFKKPVDDPS